VVVLGVGPLELVELVVEVVDLSVVVLHLSVEKEECGQVRKRSIEPASMCKIAATHTIIRLQCSSNIQGLELLKNRRCLAFPLFSFLCPTTLLLLSFND
jgi:hypothetical protein